MGTSDYNSYDESLRMHILQNLKKKTILLSLISYVAVVWLISEIEWQPFNWSRKGDWFSRRRLSCAVKKMSNGIENCFKAMQKFERKKNKKHKHSKRWINGFKIKKKARLYNFQSRKVLPNPGCIATKTI